jgi:hypothetical protein
MIILDYRNSKSGSSVVLLVALIIIIICSALKSINLFTAQMKYFYSFLPSNATLLQHSRSRAGNLRCKVMLSLCVTKHYAMKI